MDTIYTSTYISRDRADWSHGAAISAQKSCGHESLAQESLRSPAESHLRGRESHKRGAATDSHCRANLPSQTWKVEHQVKADYSPAFRLKVVIT